MSESAITQLMEITGLDRHHANTILQINNNNLEEAINYHLEGGGGDGGGDSSVSENASLPDFLPIENDRKLNYIDNDNIRPPILPIREQLIQPEYDQFSYQYNNNNINTRKRRLIPAKFTVCPFRNFAREAEQQEEQFINGGGGVSGIINNNTERNYNNRLEYNNISEYNNQNLQSQRGLLTSAKRKRLEDLFRPPSDILFLGTFQAARDHATNLNRWLIVNLQDHHEFQSQILNRDIWPDKRIKEIILSHFILCQISLDNPEGIRFKTFYRVINLPYVCILDPRTGEDKLTCDTTTPSILFNQFIKFLDDNSYGLDPNDPPFNNLQREQKHKSNDSSLSTITGPSTSTKCLNKISKYELIDTATTDLYNKKPFTIDNNDGTINRNDNNKINNKQPLLELSEQDQLNLAIQNSLKEKRCTITANKYYNSDDDDDDDDDDDNDVYDDNNTNDTNSDIDNINYDNSNQKNNRNELNNDDDHQQLYNKTGKNDIESYTNYMGNITDQLTKIQIRTPFGDRECLEWPSSTLLRAIVLYVQEKYPTITKNTYKLIAPYPKQNILELDNQLTLIDAKLYPSAVLYLHPDD